MVECKAFHLPPNMYARVLNIEGKACKRDYLPAKGISREHYTELGACDAKYLEIIWEFTPNGTRAKKPIILATERVGATHIGALDHAMPAGSQAEGTSLTQKGPAIH